MDSEACGKALSLAELLKEELDIPGVHLALSSQSHPPPWRSGSGAGLFWRSVIRVSSSHGKGSWPFSCRQYSIGDRLGKADGFPDGREHSPAHGEGCMRDQDDKGKW